MQSVLLVDDDSAQAQVIFSALVESGLQVTLVGSSMEALQEFHENPGYDLVISNAVMPDISGFQLCREIKSCPHTRRPILLVMEAANRRDLLACLAAGGDAYIVKPPNPEILLKKVNLLLGAREAIGTDGQIFNTTLDIFGEQVKITTSGRRLANLLITSLEDITLANEDLINKKAELQRANTKLRKYAIGITDELGETRSKLDLRAKIIAALDQALLVVDVEDGDYRVIDANQAVFEILGYESAELIDKNLPDLGVDNNNNSKIRSIFQSATRQKSNVTDLLKLRRKDGSEIWCKVAITAVEKSGGDSRLYACEIEDVTVDHLRYLSMEYLSQEMKEEGDLFEDILSKLCSILDMEIGFICRIEKGTASTVLMLENQHKKSNFSYELEGTPCQSVIDTGDCIIKDSAIKKFPTDNYLREKSISSYAGIRLKNAKDQVIGLVGLMSSNRIVDETAIQATLKVFGAALARELVKERTLRAYMSVFTLAPDALLLIDEAGVIQVTNIQAEKLFGYTAIEMKGAKASVLIPGELRRQYSKFISAYIKNPDIRMMGDGGRSLWAQTKTGHKVMVEISLGPVDMDGANWVLVAVRDASERRRSAADRAAREAAEQANLAKSSFLATMSHEIRTPINGVIGSAEMLSRLSLDTDQRDLVNSIVDSGNALLHVVDEILDFSKIEAGRMEIGLELVDIRELIESICKSIIVSARKAGVEFSLFIDPAIPVNIKSDPLRLRQILTNLLSNAIRFSSNKTGSGRVDLRVEPAQEENIRYVVSDNGIGMSSEFLGKIFSPFTQAEASTTRKYGGTGLGMTICKRLIDLLDGEIEVSSRKNKGTTFTVTLPHHVNLNVAKKSVNEDLSGVACLIVGSNQKQVEDWSTYLSCAHAICQSCNSMDEAAEIVCRSPYEDLVVIVDCPLAMVREWHNKLGSYPPPRTVIVNTSSTRRRIELVEENIYALDVVVMLSWKLLAAVAVAAGRKAIGDVFGVFDEQGALELELPSREQAIAERTLILVAEDNEINQLVITRQLTMLGFAVDVVGDGVAAFEAWSTGIYGLILTDLHMPSMDGYELVGQIRSAGGVEASIPIIALTANALIGEREKCLRYGMNDYLSKPITLDSLQNALYRWLNPEIQKRKAVKRPSLVLNGATTIPAEYSILDVRKLGEFFDNDPAMTEKYLKKYYQSLIHHREKVKAAIDEKRYSEIASLAHRIKPSAQMFGSKYLGDCCANLEKYGSLPDTPINEEEVDNFFKHTSDALNALKKYLQ